MRAAWDIFDYELMQLHGLWQQFQEGSHDGQPLVIRNALVESAVMHLRIILEMLRDPPAEQDNYCLADLIDMKDKPAALPCLMNIYQSTATYQPMVEALLGGDAANIAPNLKLSPCAQINKLMMHPTKRRTTSHDWSPILNILAPRLGPIIQDLRRCAVR